ncbi:DUF421 domain-containing protein [Jeotgalibacillus proteolyticus]|uniref:DUF421 domain-containing protein n=1 Tax=Jeotgalibacillus proteolyticus TaxID=2082395 RepID=A0A2S5G873_9BACL|nr:DUF421 domain-containing protein [Jeotgalibacillus proteolyticus]PPA69178.1 DUF421 domain-containing protein [Jeotgalibacillus proteolyticus]
MSQYLSIAVELTAGLVILFIVTKAQGKTQFSQITPFDFISALILGELLGNAVYDREVNLFHILFAVIVWGVIIYTVELLTQKFAKARKFLEGEPNIAILKGHIKYEALKKAKLDINQLQCLIRQQGYFSIQEVEYAIIETNGLVSVLPKSAFETPKKADFNMSSEQPELPINIILDGEVIYHNLEENGIEEEWLKKQLSKQNISRYKDVLFAEWVPNKSLYVMGYEKGKQ